MSGIRIIALLTGIAIAAALQFWFEAAWYIYMPAMVIGYLVVRYAGWAVNERRRLHREMTELAEKARRGEPL